MNPKDDIEIITTELILADLQTLENAIPRLEKEVRGKKTDPEVLAAAQRAKEILEKGTTCSPRAWATTSTSARCSS